jgi:teichoic acid transport system ATP-binding protein
MSVVAVVEDVHVSYRTYLDPKRGLRGLATGQETRRRHHTVHAVRGASFELHEGEYFGLIGANGSGKSTLLTAMTGLIPLDQGLIRVRSRPRLLGVGVAALRGGVSGRLNLIIGGLAVGLKLKDINARLDELIEFVGIGDAIDRPIQSYSQGQRARLNFTVATLTSPDILLVDEALAVGDAKFKLRSEQRIQEILGTAGAVVMVSHNVGDLAERCTRVGWLKDGEMVALGDPHEVVDAYLEHAGAQRKVQEEDS